MSSTLNSADEALHRFSTPDAAEKYNRALVGTKKHEREIVALREALSNVSSGSSLLDFPCGTGRLYSTLKEKGYEITAVDSSFYMANTARSNRTDSETSNNQNFAVSDVLQTAFSDNAFDAVVCNRLFHHFYESIVRKQALAELARIARNQVIISYYSNQSLDTVTFRLKNWLRNKKPTDRVPISPKKIKEEAASAGLKVIHEIPTRSVISMQTYLVFEHA